MMKITLGRVAGFGPGWALPFSPIASPRGVASNELRRMKMGYLIFAPFMGDTLKLPNVDWSALGVSLSKIQVQ